mmetsp:Transcript_13898/g.40001  ORF Transcript_13898/g.40001 Transcript_13898/m.40001 type:complete len:486 (-) Transcript_13898:201-1658(-)
MHLLLATAILTTTTTVCVVVGPAAVGGAEACGAVWQQVRDESWCGEEVAFRREDGVRQGEGQPLVDDGWWRDGEVEVNEGLAQEVAVHPLIMRPLLPHIFDRREAARHSAPVVDLGGVLLRHGHVYGQLGGLVDVVVGLVQLGAQGRVPQVGQGAQRLHVEPFWESPVDAPEGIPVVGSGRRTQQITQRDLCASPEGGEWRDLLVQPRAPVGVGAEVETLEAVVPVDGLGQRLEHVIKLSIIEEKVSFEQILVERVAVRSDGGGAVHDGTAGDVNHTPHQTQRRPSVEYRDGRLLCQHVECLVAGECREHPELHQVRPRLGHRRPPGGVARHASTQVHPCERDAGWRLERPGQPMTQIFSQHQQLALVLGQQLGRCQCQQVSRYEPTQHTNVHLKCGHLQILIECDVGDDVLHHSPEVILIAENQQRVECVDGRERHIGDDRVHRAPSAVQTGNARDGLQFVGREGMLHVRRPRVAVHVFYQQPR